MAAARRDDDVELAGLVDATQQPGVALPAADGGEACYTFYSEQERARHAAGERRRAGALSAVHTPCGAGAEQALEVSVLSLCGRRPSTARRATFGCAAALCAIVCGLCAVAYPRDPEFTLNAAQRALGSLGVFVVLAGACALACVWFPGTHCVCTTALCALAHADAVLITCEDGSQHVAAVVSRPGVKAGDVCRCVTFRHVRFRYCADADAFVVEDAADPLADAAALGLSLTQGLCDDTVERRRAWHGRNLIDVAMPSVPRQLADEVLNPFVFFQLFSCVQVRSELARCGADAQQCAAARRAALRSRRVFQRAPELNVAFGVHCNAVDAAAVLALRAHRPAHNHRRCLHQHRHLAPKLPAPARPVAPRGARHGAPRRRRAAARAVHGAGARRRC
jgi:hypothetical protein